jgi:competence protein ComEA
VSAASRPARDGPITPAGLGSPPAAGSAPSVGPPVTPDPCRTRAGPARPIALNSASQADLEELPGIGPAKARRILDWRGKHGRFRRIVDLRRVKGFGRKTVMRLAPYLVLDAPPVTTSSSRPANTPPPVAGSK